MAVQVRGRRADDLDPIDDLGGDAVDENRTVVAPARNRPTIDENLGKTSPQSAQGGCIILADVATECDTRNALERIANRRGLELLEEFLAERQLRRDRVRSLNLPHQTKSPPPWRRLPQQFPRRALGLVRKVE